MAGCGWLGRAGLGSAGLGWVRLSKAGTARGGGVVRCAAVLGKARLGRRGGARHGSAVPSVCLVRSGSARPAGLGLDGLSGPVWRGNGLAWPTQCKAGMAELGGQEPS